LINPRKCGDDCFGIHIQRKFFCLDGWLVGKTAFYFILSTVITGYVFCPIQMLQLGIMQFFDVRQCKCLSNVARTEILLRLWTCKDEIFIFSNHSWTV